MATDVNVKNVGGTFIEDLGRSVLPANVLPFDFSAIDRAVETENEISNKALDVMMNNVKDLGRIQDELTGITVPSAYHHGELEAAKKSLGIDRAALVNVVSNIENPMAAYDMDRKLKRLASDPRVKEIMYDNAIVDHFKNNIPAITDPNLRAQAIKNLQDVTQSNDRNAVKSLNLDQYKTIDLEAAYEETLNQFAPYIPSVEHITKPDGSSYTLQTNKRDPEMVAKTREYFMRNPGVRNNLIANGYIDDTGKPLSVGKTTWFDDLEAPQLAPIQQISNVKGASGGSGGSGKYNYTLSENLKGLSYTPDVKKDTNSGLSFDLGVISGAETSGRHPDKTVHVDFGNNAINIGAYAFNGGGLASTFLDSLDGHAMAFPNAMSALTELKSIPLKGGNLEANAARAKAAYKKLDDALGPGVLKGLEDDFAIEQFATPIIDYLHSKEGFDDIKLTVGDSTLLMDAAIQWKPKTWKKWIDEYTESDTNASLAEFITRKRIEEAAKNANNGVYVSDGNMTAAEKAQAIGDRAVRVWQAAAEMDGNSSTPKSPQAQQQNQQNNNPGIIDVNQFNQYLPDGVEEKADSISNAATNSFMTIAKQKNQ